MCARLTARPIKFQVLKVQLRVAAAEIIVAEIFFKPDIVWPKPFWHTLDLRHRAANMIIGKAFRPVQYFKGFRIKPGCVITLLIRKFFWRDASIGIGLAGNEAQTAIKACISCLLYTSPSPRDGLLSRMPSSA